MCASQVKPGRAPRYPQSAPKTSTTVGRVDPGSEPPPRELASPNNRTSRSSFQSPGTDPRSGSATAGCPGNTRHDRCDVQGEGEIDITSDSYRSDKLMHSRTQSVNHYSGGVVNSV